MMRENAGLVIILSFYHLFVTFYCLLFYFFVRRYRYEQFIAKKSFEREDTPT